MSTSDLDSETIVGVSIISKGVRYDLPKPNRHHHCIHKAFLAEGKQVVTESQGFVTNLGRYVDRKEAMVIARLANQLIKEPTIHDTLYSEDVWSTPILPSWTVLTNGTTPSNKWISTCYYFFENEDQAKQFYDEQHKLERYPTLRPFHFGNDFKHLNPYHQRDYLNENNVK